MLTEEQISGIFEELYEMKVIIPNHPGDFYTTLLQLQKYLNRMVEIQVGVLSEMSKVDLTKSDRSRLKALKEAADVVLGNLKLTKQQFALVINNSEVLDMPKPSKEIDFSHSDIPGQSVKKGTISVDGLEFFDDSEDF